jgi:hypothetical protein
MAADRDIDRVDHPDVEMGARVKAKRVRFKRKPETDVRPYAGPDGETTSGSERKNLPEEVEPGVTYRDVEVRWRAAARTARAAERGGGRRR